VPDGPIARGRSADFGCRPESLLAMSDLARSIENKKLYKTNINIGFFISFL
jgi:hypothetical protein